MAWTAATTRTTGELVTASIWNTDIVDNLNYVVNSSGGLDISSTGPHGLGLAAASSIGLRIGNDITTPAATTGIGLSVGTIVRAATGASAYGVYLAPELIESSSGDHGVLASLLVAPVFTNGGATTSYASTVHIGGVPSIGTNTAALLIDAVGNDGPHIVLADSSDVAHGITDAAPTIAYGIFRKASSTDGGLSIQGLSEGSAGAQLIGYATTESQTETGGTRGNINLISIVKAGTGSGAHSADGNSVVFINQLNATHIFKGNGDSYEDGTGWTAYDNHDDIALIEALEYEITSAQGNPIKREFSALLTEQRELLTQLRLATFCDDGRIYVNRSGMQALICGFARQMTRRVMNLEARVTAMEAVR